MLKTQKNVHEMMKALDLPLPNEERPGLVDLNFHLLRNLVTEEADEFDIAMEALHVLQARESGWRERVLNSVVETKGVGAVARFRWMSEPEFYQSMTMFWWAEAIDAICDVIVVLHNTSNAMGVDIEPFFDEVHRANMTKADGPLREDGKRLKPPGFVPPRIEAMLRALLETGKAEL